MKVVHSLADASSSRASAVTIGNFDGVHRGHRAILDAVGERARRSGALAVAVTFDPHPLWQIAPERAPVPISTLEQKIRLIGESAIDTLLIQKFDDTFRQMPPEAFIESFLIEALHARSVCVGENFRFGHRHRGNMETLGRWSQAFEVVEIPPVVERRQPISSSRIREEIANGRVGRARHMLGRCYEIEGHVVAGAGRGRRLNVPTLNLASDNALIPANGVYLTRASVDGGPCLDALTNVGVRPTFDGQGPGAERSIETHIPDSMVAASPARMRVRFVKRLRDERRFDGPAELREQIERDIRAARRFFRRMDRLGDERTVECSAGNEG